MTVRTLVREGTQRLLAVGIGPAQHETEWLLAQLLDSTPLELYLGRPEVSESVVEQFRSQIAARAAGQPLQYLLGEAEFFNRRFTVIPDVFIPRPETETIVDAVLRTLQVTSKQAANPLQLLDLGTGSGCIAVTLARCLPACVVVGVELSWKALSIAQQNATRHGVVDRVRWVQGHWCEPIRGAFDGIVANPPYIPSASVDRLPLDVRREPRLSLDGGADGMRDLSYVMSEAPRLLRRGAIVACECGEEQVEPLVKRAAAASWVANVTALRDLADRPRGLLIQAR